MAAAKGGGGAAENDVMHATVAEARLAGGGGGAGSSKSLAQSLGELKAALEEGLVTQEEHDASKAKVRWRTAPKLTSEWKQTSRPEARIVVNPKSRSMDITSWPEARVRTQ